MALISTDWVEIFPNYTFLNSHEAMVSIENGVKIKIFNEAGCMGFFK